MNFPPITQLLPAWLQTETERLQEPMDDVETRMRAVIALSQRNITEGTGGPFAAAVFDRQTNRLVSTGVNLVISSGLSIAHAEIMAFSVAQQLLHTYDLGAGALKGRYELVSSAEPCAMCFGALPWTGVSNVVCGATNADACAIGFDEGPRHPRWIEELQRRGIEVQTSVCRDEARRVLAAYTASGGTIYNGHGD